MATWPANLTDPNYASGVLQTVVGWTEGDVNAAIGGGWASVTSSIPGHTATFLVFADALKIDGVRINVSAVLQQQIADALGCLLLTPKLADLLYAQRAVTLTPKPMPIASTSAAMISESQKIDAALLAAGVVESGKIVQTTGKHWVIDNATLGGKACNYGWHLPAGTPSPWQGVPVYPSVTSNSMVIQQPGTAHNPQHIDYSQTCTLVNRWCMVDGQKRDLADVLIDPVLSALASHDGPLSTNALRQPGASQFVCKLPIPSPTPAIISSRVQTPSPSGLCPPPPPPSFPEPPETTDWPLVVGGGLAIAAVVTGFVLAIRYAGRATRK
jgi:hypothetical protein